MSKQERKTNSALVSLIGDLKDHSRTTGSPIWRDTASRLETSRKTGQSPILAISPGTLQRRRQYWCPARYLEAEASAEGRRSPPSASAMEPRAR